MDTAAPRKRPPSDNTTAPVTTRVMPMSDFRETLKTTEPIRAEPVRVDTDKPGAVGRWLRGVALAIVGVGILGVLGLVTGIVRMPQRANDAADPPPDKSAPLLVALVPGMPHTLSVPEEVQKSLGIRNGGSELVAVARPPSEGKSLMLPGSTMLEPGRIMRIRARFAPSPSSAEVVEIAQRTEFGSENSTGETLLREIRAGDHVKKGEMLAVFFSVDVGNKKNDLVDAIYQLKLDEDILKRAQQVPGAVPEVFILNAKRNVEGDRNAVNRAVHTLETWGIPAEDIQAVRDEAENVAKREGKRDKQKEATWPRVELRAPDDGVIVERNVSMHEIVADNTTNLFQIAKVDRLDVIANAPEDDLPALQALPELQRRWTVRTIGAAPLEGLIDDIGYIIDPNQHTAVVKGHIENPGEVLRAGQFISAEVKLPAPSGVVEVPIDAVNDDGQQCVVFVETNAAKHEYTMRRVDVTHRFEKSAFVRSTPFNHQEQPRHDEQEMGILPKEPLRPGERVLTTGVGELKAALLDLESDAKNPSQNKGG